MKTITKKIEVYSFEELDEKAKANALKEETDDVMANGLWFLDDDLNERLHELLIENSIQDLNDTSKPNTKPTKVYYSLDYCQGDGCMFEGNFIWNGLNVTIKHSGNYYHSNSKTIEIESPIEEDTKKAEKEFENIYQSICKTLERYGYDTIEYASSEERAIENFIDNEATFLKSGERYFENI